MQFGFMKGEVTSNTIFIVRQTQKFRAKGKKLYFGFVVTTAKQVALVWACVAKRRQ